MPRLLPGFSEPRHLAPFVDELARSEREPVRVVVAAPPQHGKTVTIKAALVRRLQLRDRTRRSAFVTYNEDKAQEESLAAQRMADEVGLNWGGKLGRWGVGSNIIRWTSIGGSLTGHPIDDLLVIDDPIKDREQAESAHQRERVWGWWESVAKTRLHPSASVIVMATRWHVDDLSGRLAKAGWRYINLQAIDDVTGLPLWPEERPLDYLMDIRRTSSLYVWNSLYQGNPQPRGGKVFGAPRYYRELPKNRYQVAYGVDLAYTASSRADRSVLFELLRYDPPKKSKHDKPPPLYYVKSVLSTQVEQPLFARRLQAAQKPKPKPMLFLGAGTEKGAASFLMNPGEFYVPGFRMDPVVSDKFVRAQPLAAAWDRVFWPDPDVHHVPWLPDVLDVFGAFTGKDDPRDDEVDAAAAAFRCLEHGYSDRRPLDVYQ